MAERPAGASTNTPADAPVGLGVPVEAAQRRLADEVRAVAQKLLAPRAAARDLEGLFPREEIRALAARGYLGMTVETSFGGLGWNATTAVLALMEISEACASTGLVLGFHNLVVCEIVARLGTTAQREEHLRGLAAGGQLGALAMTDPLASEPERIPLGATREGDRVRLRGSKRFVPGALNANLFLVYARAPEEPGSGRRRVLYILPRSLRGLEIGPSDAIFGVKAAGVASLRFHDCVVPASAQLGAIEDARLLSPELLAPANLAVAAQAVGIASAAFEKAVSRARMRESSGGILGARQAIQWKLADMQVLLAASRLLVLRAAEARDHGEPYAYPAAQAKVFAGRAAARIADESIQVFGGSGAIMDGGVERHWRDAKTTELNPTSREAAQLSVARVLLEEPR